MRIQSTLAICAALVWSAFSTLTANAATTYSISQGPESVFDQPLADIFPDLSGAARTDESGRRGAELVYWGFRLADGKSVMFYACAPGAGVDCGDRGASICRNTGRVLKTATASGKITRKSCTRLCDVTMGKSCCTTEETPATLAVGLVECS
jgi:hypothetical protein